MTLGWEMAVDVGFLTAFTAFSVFVVSHVAAMWIWRHDFLIAVRSPLLAITSGLASGLFSCVSMYDLILGERPTLHGSSTFFHLVGQPIYIPVTMVAYFMRAVRLLVVYNPRLRRRWGRILKEKAILRGILVPPLLLQVVIWSTVPVYGAQRVEDVITSFMGALSLSIFVLAAFFLGGKLKATEKGTLSGDVAQEMLVLGASTMASAGLFAVAAAVDMPSLAVKYYMIIWMVITFYPPLWFTNVAPVRDVLRRNTNGKGRVPLLPGLAWRSATVAHGRDTSRHRSVHSPSTSISPDPALENTLAYLPLREAFQEFCRKALCSESFEFLLAAIKFRTLLLDESNKCTDHFGVFLAIAEEFISNSSPSEINIDSLMKHNIMKYAKRDDFMELTVNEQIQVLRPAEKEVSKMLSENLLRKFEASAAHKEIADELLLTGSHTSTEP